MKAVRAPGLDALKNPVGKSCQPANRISLYGKETVISRLVGGLGFLMLASWSGGEEDYCSGTWVEEGDVVEGGLSLPVDIKIGRAHV